MTTPLRVLIVEDVPSDAKLVLLALRAINQTIESQRVEDAPSMLAALQTKNWQLVISDWSLPKFSALAALELVRASGLDLPFIIVSGTIGEEAAADAMRTGANDYVLKSNLARLAPAVERELREVQSRRDRQRVDEALRAQEARFRAVVEHSQDGIIMTSREGKTHYVSPAGKLIMGRVEGEYLEASPLIHPDDRPRVAEFMAKLIAHPSATFDLELRSLLPDGSIRWLEAVGTNLLDEPRIEAIVGNFRDVTERKNAIDALRASKTQFARLSESGVIGIALADVQGTIHEANDAYRHMLGYSHADPLLSWAENTPEQWRELDERAVSQLNTEGVAPAFEKELLRKDGTRAPVLIGIAMLEGTSCIAFVADLSARKKAEAALRQTEEQLRHSQKMEAIGVLAGGVAHDFNNLLSVILSFSELVMMELPEKDPLRADVGEIKEAGHRAAALTRQLLAFSRHQIIDPQVLDLNDIIKNMDKMLRRIIREDVELATLPYAGLGKCRSDADQIEQVIMNLVVNARDAMPNGGKLTIETANVDLSDDFARTHFGVKPGRYVMLAISDSGSGMDKATQARIFEPFFTTKEKGKGTGLGLSTVFGIVEQSGGTIWVYSEIGKGTTFKVYLPCTSDAPNAAMAKPVVTDVRGTETLLLVEDEDQIRNVAKGILQRHGYRVMEARNAGEALLASEQFSGTIHLLLTDVVMPHMSGKQLAQRLTPLRPEMKVLFMSGYTDGVLVDELAAGSAFLQKPLTPGALTQKVREVLDQAPTRSK